MSFIQNFYTSRDNNANTITYVGQTDRLWYDPNTNTLRVSNGSTPGGLPVDLSINANANINTLTVRTINSPTGTVSLTGNIAISGNISPAAVGKIGGVQPGPGANISNTGLLTIDTAGLPLSFGNFTASNNILSIVNADENMILATQGNAIIQLVGNIGFYRTDGPNPAGQYFNATNDGIISIIVTATGNQGAFNIIGSTTGTEISPGQTGAMMHITGQLSDPCRIYFDGNDNYVSLVGRRWNGNVNNPTQVLAGEDVVRINSTAATDAGIGNVGMAQIRTTALENQTTTAQGSSITFTVTPIGSSASARVDVANVTTANGVWATKFTSSGTVSAAGNITGGNILTAGIVSSTGNATHGNILTGGIISATGNATVGNINATNHTGTTVSVTGNVTGGNVTTAGTTTTTNLVYDSGPFDNGSITTALTLDFDNGSLQTVTLGASNPTFTLANARPGKVILLIVKNTSGANRTITHGVAAANTTTGGATVVVNNNRIGMLQYVCPDATTANVQLGLM